MAAKKNTVTYNGTGRRKTSVARVFMTPGASEEALSASCCMPIRLKSPILTQARSW